MHISCKNLVPNCTTSKDVVIRTMRRHLYFLVLLLLLNVPKVINQETTSTVASVTNTPDQEQTTSVPPRIPSPVFRSSRFRKSSFQQKLKVFNDLLDSDLDPKGYPFPKIYGPKPEERVCIVGGGPAGVHMSLSLKKKGFLNVTIFEKTGRVGGKSYDVHLGGESYQPQGSFIFSSDYFGSLVTLAEEYGVGEHERVPDFGVGDNCLNYAYITKMYRV